VALTTVRLIVLGATGRMGRRVCRLALREDDFEIVGAVASPKSPNLGEDIGELVAGEPVGVEISPPEHVPELAEEADVAIDFTRPEATLENALPLVEAGVDLVIGTTGFNEEQERELVRIIEENEVAAVISPNMSLGVNLVYELIRRTVEALKGRDFDFEIVEIHHRHKEDAPSGTALEMARIVEEIVGDLKVVTGREGRVGPRGDDEIGIMAVRGGEVVGDHTFMALGEHERIEITHRAASRDAFAKGALVAARSVVDMNPGIYNMTDVLFGD